jgi:hypothetical protein
MKEVVLKKISVLLVFSVLLILICVLIIVFNFKAVIDPFGYQFMAMIIGIGFGIIGLLILKMPKKTWKLGIGFGIIGLFVDFILSLTIKNKIVLNITELLLVSLFLVIVCPK